MEGKDVFKIVESSICMKIAVARISGRIFLIEFWGGESVSDMYFYWKSFQICLVQKNENVIFRAIFIPFNKEKILIDGLSCHFHEGEIYLPQYFPDTPELLSILSFFDDVINNDIYNILFY